PRPRDTGWFAGFDGLADGAAAQVAYAPDGSRFMGATFDPTPLHRMAAVFAWMDEIGLSVAAIHEHVLGLQALFLARVESAAIDPLRRARLVTPTATAARRHGRAGALPVLGAAGCAADPCPPCRRRHRHRRARGAHPLRLRLLPHRVGHRSRRRGDGACARVTGAFSNCAARRQSERPLSFETPLAIAVAIARPSGAPQDEV